MVHTILGGLVGLKKAVNKYFSNKAFLPKREIHQCFENVGEDACGTPPPAANLFNLLSQFRFYPKIKEKTWCDATVALPLRCHKSE